MSVLRSAARALVPQPERADRAKRFWNERAREHALYFVDSRVEYRDPDERQFWEQGERDLDVLLDLAGTAIGSDDSVVEIGCGVGRLTRCIAARAGDVRAVDVAPEMLELARRYNGALRNVTWIEGDGASLAQVETASADACVSHVVFQHIPDPRVTLEYVREMARVLRPGGWSAFQVSNDPSAHERMPRFGERLGALVRRSPRGRAHPNWRGSAADLDDLREVAGAAGMDVRRVVGAGTQFCVVLLRKRSA